MSTATGEIASNGDSVCIMEENNIYDIVPAAIGTSSSTSSSQASFDTALRLDDPGDKTSKPKSRHLTRERRHRRNKESSTLQPSDKVMSPSRLGSRKHHTLHAHHGSKRQQGSTLLNENRGNIYDSIESSTVTVTRNAGDDDIYESLEFRTSADSDMSWGSSEFDSEAFESEEEEDFSHKPLPQVPESRRKRTGSEPLEILNYGLISKLRDSFTPRRHDSDSEEESPCLHVTLSLHKHPPPTLPPAPDGLSENQIKRRLVLESIISSEKSYVTALQRIVEGYERPLLEVLSLHKSKVSALLRKVREILQYHMMFQIELAEQVAKWNENETIGDVFTASFSKSMVLDTYSTYVNTFSVAMEEIKSTARNKQALRDFLRLCEVSSPDRLSIFGLLVKPVQRFPQFTLLLQDLLKYTPSDHKDRSALQLALTEVESLAHKLNERKGESEQRFEAKQLLSRLKEMPKGSDQKHRRLIRQDDLLQVVNQPGVVKSKRRRLILLNDVLVCCTILPKKQESDTAERVKFKWSAPIKDIEMKDSAITPELQSALKGDIGRMSITSPKLEAPDNDPFHLVSDLGDMLHDYTILTQITALSASLKKAYLSLSEDMLHQIMRDLQRQIQMKDEQVHLVNSCSILLTVPTRMGKMKCVFQCENPSLKQYWCLSFLTAKLAFEPQNMPSWDVSHNTNRISLHMPALFIKCLPVDVPRHFTKVQCAVPLFLSSPTSGGLGVQHLWVCSSTDERGQVSIVSANNNKSALTESFQACTCPILCVETVPGWATKTHRFAFHGDTVWMATGKAEIVVYNLYNTDSILREPVSVFRMTSNVVVMKYESGNLFAAHDNGSVTVFIRDDDGIWNIEDPRIMKLGTAPITCMLSADEYVLVACGNTVFFIQLDTGFIQRKNILSTDSSHIDQMVRTGVGLWISYKKQSIIRLYHSETMDHLQDINISSAVERMTSGKSRLINVSEVHVSCLLASRGMLWIGTNIGVILSLPLPRLREGVPLVSERPSVSYHAHNGPVRFLLPLHAKSNVVYYDKSVNVSQEHSINSKQSKPDTDTSDELISGEKKEINQSDTVTDSLTPSETVAPTPSREVSEHSQFLQSYPPEGSSIRSGSKTLSFRSELREKVSHFSQSHPNLLETIDGVEHVKSLYGSLMRGVDTNFAKRISDLKEGGSKMSIPEDDGQNKQSDVKNSDAKEETNGKKIESITTQKAEKSGLTLQPSFRRECGSMRGSTLKLNMPTAVTVISGGDGYTDWNEKNPNSKSDEACLLLWLCKV